jgi:hypothetical protein
MPARLALSICFSLSLLIAGIPTSSIFAVEPAASAKPGGDKPSAGKPAPSEPIRIADVIGGHIHPSLCRTPKGDLLAVYNKQGGGGKELLVTRSQDGGQTWSQPVAVPTIKDCSIYPGSLTVLSDGRILLNWSCYHVDGDRRWRTPHFCTSGDDGRTWSEVTDVPLEDFTNYSCLRHPVMQLSPHEWVLPLYDRTIVYNEQKHAVRPFGDGRNHGMVPILRTPGGAVLSGAPQAHAPVPVGKPGETVRGLRSTDGGQTWKALHALPYFGVAGYDFCTLDNDWIVLTSIIYGVGRDGEWAYELIVSRDDGVTWDREHSLIIHNPGRNIPGRGWPRTVQIDADSLGTVFFDLSATQPGGPGLFFIRTPIAALTTE